MTESKTERAIDWQLKTKHCTRFLGKRYKIPRTRNSELGHGNWTWNSNSELRTWTYNSELGTRNLELGSRNLDLGTWNSDLELATWNSAFRTLILKLSAWNLMETSRLAIKHKLYNSSGCYGSALWFRGIAPCCFLTRGSPGI